MRQELEDKLIKRFPFYKVGKTIGEYFHYGFECDDGWFKLLWKLSKDLELANFTGQVIQVKEKFGELRFYHTGCNDVCEYLINDAEESSAFICEICGRKGKLRKIKGWLKTLCLYHYLKRRFING